MNHPNPLFVFGVARSGTSYLYFMLRSHPQARITYEGLIVKEAYDYYAKHQDPKTREQFDELLESLANIEAEQTENLWLVDIMRKRKDSLWEKYRANPGFSELIEAIYLEQSDIKGPAENVGAWGNKLLRLEFAPELIERWPDCKIVILIRDPRAVYVSQSKLFGHQLRYSSIYWNLHASLARMNAKDSDRVMIVKYEELVARPTEVLAQVFTHAGLEAQENVRRILEEMPASTASLDKWKTVMTDEQIELLESLCFDEMKLAGYEPKLATAQRNQGAIERAYVLVRQYAGQVPLDLEWWRRKRVLQRFFAAVSGRSL